MPIRQSCDDIILIKTPLDVVKVLLGGVFSRKIVLPSRVTVQFFYKSQPRDAEVQLKT